MKKIAIVHLGDKKPLQLMNALEKKHQLLQINTNDALSTKSASNQITIDPANIPDSTDNLHAQMPIHSVIIACFFEKLLSDQQLKQLLNDYFLFVKILYKPYMRQKNGQIWLFQPVLPEHPTNALILSINAGIRMLAWTLAMELSKKKVNVNYVQNITLHNHSEQSSLIQWAMAQEKIYLTSQAITLKIG